MKEETFWQFLKHIFQYQEVQAVIAALLIVTMAQLVLFGLVVIGLIKLAQLILM